jgi:hypothetical protein
MARIFTIRFSLSDTFHDALVNVVDCATFLEYHLKATDEMVDNIIKDYNIFQLERNRFTLKKKPSNKEAAAILESMMHAIAEYENKRMPVVSLIV